MNVAFVLHSHLPWLRRNGTHPVGEEWLFQAWSESYLPLLAVLERLGAAGHRDLLSLGFTPILAEQMDDPYLLAEFRGWLGRRLVDLEYTVARYGGADGHRLGEVWTGHWRRQRELLEWVESRLLTSGLTAPFRALADAGVIELLGGPATHPYLALMDDPALIRGQIDGGLALHERVFGRRPRGVWAPECAYRPAGPVADPTLPPASVAPDGTPTLRPSSVSLPGLEEFWAEAGVGHLVLDGPTLARAAGAPDRDWSDSGGQTIVPGGALDVLDRPVRIGDSDVVAFGRNLAVSYAVWNPHGGYPADPWYRDFHRLDLEGGFKSWRVTDRQRWDKEPYDPLPARERAVSHAEHFVGLLRAHLAPRGVDAVVLAAYDTELFGHWWFEGPVWLETVLRELAGATDLRTTTLAGYLERHPAIRHLHLPESSWGRGKGHAAWVSDATRWIWQALRDAEARFRSLPAGASRDAAWRQLCLLQASDWPFMVTRDQSTRYAEERVRTHLARFDAACRGEGLDLLAERDDPARRPAPAARPPAPSDPGALSAARPPRR
jgi:1,4-alpha-glucan branching enzyme